MLCHEEQHLKIELLGGRYAPQVTPLSRGG